MLSVIDTVPNFLGHVQRLSGDQCPGLTRMGCEVDVASRPGLKLRGATAYEHHCGWSSAGDADARSRGGPNPVTDPPACRRPSVVLRHHSRGLGVRARVLPTESDIDKPISGSVILAHEDVNRGRAHRFGHGCCSS